MALVKFGGGITQMAGSIAGNVFARNRYGNYVRARTTPINPNTARQQVVRAALAFLTARWSDTLTAVQRTAWNLYAANVVMLNRLGESVHLSGYNHYIRSNMIRKQIQAAIIDDGPVVFELPEQDSIFAITGSEATQQISIAFDNGLPWADENGAFMVTFQGSPQNPQRNFFDGPWRYMDTTAGVNGAPPASPVAANVQYAISELQHDWCYARILRADGRLGEPFRDDCFIAA